MSLIPQPKTEEFISHGKLSVMLLNGAVDCSGLTHGNHDAAALTENLATRSDSLMKINLANNEITEVPKVLCTFPTLQVLGLNVNHITELPVELSCLATLRALSLYQNQLTRIAPEVLTTLPSLATLNIARNELRSLPPSITQLRSLTSLDLGFNKLQHLPGSMHSLKLLKYLDVQHNELTSLPTSAVLETPYLQVMRLEGNPLQQPPASLVTGALPCEYFARVQRYFLDLARGGGLVSHAARLVTFGMGEAGKTSLVRSLQRGLPSPAAADERTVQLDISSIQIVPPDSSWPAVTLSTWDLGGQPTYAGAQQPYLVGDSLYLGAVPAHYATDADYAETLGRWLDALQARAPGAIIQLVLTQVDRVVPHLQEALGEWHCSPTAERARAVENMLSPDALARAAEPQLSWLRARVNEHQTRCAATRLASPPRQPLRVMPEIPCVCVTRWVSTQDGVSADACTISNGASLAALRQQLASIVYATPSWLSSIGQTIPADWVTLMGITRAFRDGRNPADAVVQGMGLDTTAGAGMGGSTDASTRSAEQAVLGSARRRLPYIPLSRLRTATDELLSRAGPSTTGDYMQRVQRLDDALRLMANQGELFCSGDIVCMCRRVRTRDPQITCNPLIVFLRPAVFSDLDPMYVTELLRPLVDHRLGQAGWVRHELQRFLRERAASAPLYDFLLDATARLASFGELNEHLLPFLWCGLCLSEEDKESHLQMLCTSGLLFAIEPPPDDASPTPTVQPAPLASPVTSGTPREEQEGRERRWVLPLRLGEQRPAEVDEHFPPRTLEAGQSQLSVAFCWEEVLPAGVAERSVAACQEVPQCHYRLYWRHGALLRVRGAIVLLEAHRPDANNERNVRLTIDARGPGADCWRVITRLCPRLKGLLSESFPGLLVRGTLACPGCLCQGRWDTAERWSLSSMGLDAVSDTPTDKSYCHKCKDIYLARPPAAG